MLYAYRGMSISPLPEIYKLGLVASGVGGIYSSEFVDLAMDVGLHMLRAPMSSISPTDLARWLRQYGPLWVAGRWDGPKHIIVVVGVGVDDPNMVWINDPSPRRRRRVESISWFNHGIAKGVKSPILYLPCKPKIHIVREGDWLSKLAKRYYGNSDLWHPIYWANAMVIGKDPDLIKPGQVLIIPPKQ
jgi:nucleoid-associated protein YgaU